MPAVLGDMTDQGALTDRQWTASLTDPGLPVLPELLTDQVPGPLAAAVAASDGTVTAVAVKQVTWWPGRSATVSWDTVVEGGPLAGRATYVGTTQRAPEGALVVGSEDDQVAVWRIPHDPFLPALPTALQPEVAASVITSLGGQITDPTTRLGAYRPTRRAVIEVTGQGHKVYLKLVKPRRLAALHQRHLDLVDLLPVPEPLGINSELGLLVMRNLPGRTLRSGLETPTATLPHPDVVADLPTTLPSLPGAATVPSAVEAAPMVADLLRRLLPTEADRIERVVEAIGADEVTERVPAHGDYHEAQLLVDDDGQISGLLDVDTLGVGRPGDDAGTMLGHLAVWHTMSRQPERVAAYATALQERWESRLDGADVRRRAAARILGLAAGPFRVQQQGWPLETSRRIALAERWAQSAGGR